MNGIAALLADVKSMGYPALYMQGSVGPLRQYKTDVQKGLTSKKAAALWRSTCRWIAEGQTVLLKISRNLNSTIEFESQCSSIDS